MDSPLTAFKFWAAGRHEGRHPRTCVSSAFCLLFNYERTGKCPIPSEAAHIRMVGGFHQSLVDTYMVPAIPPVGIHNFRMHHKLNHPIRRGVN
jgi:hypothetical protein